ncbi:MULTISPECIES: phage shock envelope stress response protein PspM [unclassified Pseudofrankia]|uniref:phage shock envelope stress response protein PspM n=1 Tax=unclassified Pseudofrankia TaxID=2994372 RepID=UPI0008D8F73E|nr:MULTISPECIES: hypothetical protein [unclassified Pseudofrankia]MDT3443103.1 hypothetical protein [Pseudofrankia sp. BMG5.37]OHV49957.1 hypothetical protein BCD48_11420 [Pseudofrankia sp. BMG5.36]
MPDAMAAEMERRGAQREARAATRYARHARWTAGGWAALAAVITPAGVAFGHEWWMWLLAGAGSLVNSGLWALQAARADRQTPGPPLPVSAAPGVRALTGSAAAGPLRRGEEAISAFLALARPVPPGPTADVIRSAMASAAEVVDGLRMRANRVVACEAAARALADRSARAQLAGTVQALAEEMNTAVRALDDLVAAAAEVVGAGVYAYSGGLDLGGPAPPGTPVGGAALGVAPVDLDALAEQAENLRGYAAGLRDVGAAARGLPAAGRGTAAGGAATSDLGPTGR